MNQSLNQSISMSAKEARKEPFEFQIPTITLDNNNNNDLIDGNSNVVKSLRHACENIGFFYLKVKNSDPNSSTSNTRTNDGNNNSNTTNNSNNNSNSNTNDTVTISHKLIENVFEQSKQFFNLSTKIKTKFVDSELNRGYTSMGEETLDPTNQSTGDTKEGYYISNDIARDNILYNPSKLSGPNVWPMKTNSNIDADENGNDNDNGSENNNDDDDNELLDFDLDCIKWKNTMNEYFDNLKNIGFQLVQLIALAIGLPTKHYFDDKFEHHPMAFLRLLHYSKTKSNIENGIFACGAHSDYGMLTLLATDDQPGLQILINKDDVGDIGDASGESKDRECWIDVNPPPIGTFIVNLGDMLERWTNGKFKSTVHRVVSKHEKERYSIPFFYEPNFDTVVECLDVCLGPGEERKYPKTTAGGHLLEKYNQTHADFQQQHTNSEE
jgi:isopenicillin N synthase-like dioxygenase